MFYWRLLTITLLIIGLFLFVQSLVLQNINLFYFAVGFYSLASLIWLTIEKLYVNFSMPKNPKEESSNWLNSFGYFDWFDFLDIILSLPKIIFLFLIHAIYN